MSESTAVDPTPIDPRDEAAVSAAVDSALSAIGAAADLEALKAVKIAHTGDRSPLALANRAIGGLDKADKATAGKLVGQSRGRVSRALAERQAQLEELREQQVLVEEAIDVTLPAQRTPQGARHPLQLLQ